MPCRIYRHRPPKDGGTHTHYSGDTHTPVPRAYHSLPLTSNYYNILTINSISKSKKLCSAHQPLDKCTYLRVDPIQQHTSRSPGTNIQDDLDGFTLIKKNTRLNKLTSPHFFHHNKNDTPRRSTQSYRNLPKHNVHSGNKITQSKLLNTKNKKPKQKFNSLFASHLKSNSRPQQNSASSHHQPMSNPNPDTNSPPQIGSTPTDDALMSSPFLHITHDTDDKTIAAIPLSDTWKTYQFNCPDTPLNEDDWNLLSASDQYEHLTLLKTPVTCVITSSTTPFTITPATDNNVIKSIPEQDCKILLHEYAFNQGYPNYKSKIQAMTIDAMHEELIKAKDKLSKRMQPANITNKKKIKKFSMPFVLTHDTTDDDILKAEASSIEHELKNMFSDRNILDSVMWDSLNIEDLQDMARIERDEMRKCVSTDKEDSAKKEKHTPPSLSTNGAHHNDVEVISIRDDESVITDDEDSDSVLHDDDEEHNECDKFVNEQIQNSNSNRKISRFKFNHETTDKDIFLLCHKRAKRISIQHALNIEQPLSETFVQEATTDDFHQYLIIERNQFISHHEYNAFDFNSRTTDEAIKQLKRLQLENYLIFHYCDTDRLLSDDFFQNKTDDELKFMLINERNMLRTNDPDKPPITNSNNPVQPNNLPKGLHGKRQNLNGWNITSAMSTNKNNNHSKVFHPSGNPETNPDVIQMAKNYFFIRASISTVGNGTHVPTIVRRFIKALRNSDATMQVLPFDTDDSDLNHILDTETLIPDDLTAILTWVRGIRSTTKRIHFAIRVSNTCPLSELRTDIFGWCKTNKCWIDMDYIDSEKLFACGWLCGMHPRLYNRNALKSWLDTLEPTLGNRIKLYPRTIFTATDDGKKTITNAIIIDGAVEEAKDIMKFLYSIDWNEKYKNVNFVPFRTSNRLTLKDQKKAMEFHNNYLNSTYRKIVKEANPFVEYTTDAGENISFSKWLLQSQLHGANMIDGVEMIKDGVVRIIYDKIHQEGIDFIMKTLKENAVDAFGEKISKDMLGDDFNVITHFNSELEDQYASKLKAVWTNKNVQHTSPPAQQHRLYYGNNNSENLYSQSKTRSYSEITQSTISTSASQVADSQRENSELREMIMDMKERFNDLEQQHQSFQKNLKASIKRELMLEFEGVINNFRKELNATITTIENKFDKTIQTYEKSAIEREQRFQEQGLSNFRIVAAELLKKSINESPSEPIESNMGLRGERQ